MCGRPAVRRTAAVVLQRLWQWMQAEVAMELCWAVLLSTSQSTFVRGLAVRPAGKVELAVGGEVAWEID